MLKDNLNSQFKNTVLLGVESVLLPPFKKSKRESKINKRLMSDRIIDLVIIAKIAADLESSSKLLSTQQMLFPDRRARQRTTKKNFSAVLRNAFKAFDADNKGFIETADFHTILEMMGQKLDDKAEKQLVKDNKKGSPPGKINFDEFCAMAGRFVEVEEDAAAMATELKEAFRLYDREGKGYLTVKTLRDILHELDDKLSSQELDMIIDEIDADGSGTVDFDEFMTIMQG
uniref:EF-hand domain-containing protein n=1 Tax=Megaselia scalaris TaxID=36166 RepID=T1GML3_MEGSC